MEHSSSSQNHQQGDTEEEEDEEEEQEEEEVEDLDDDHDNNDNEDEETSTATETSPITPRVAGNREKEEGRQESHDDWEESQASTPTSPSPYDTKSSTANNNSGNGLQQFDSDLVSPTIPPPVAADGQPLYNFHNTNNSSNKLERESPHQSNTLLPFPNLSNSNTLNNYFVPPTASCKDQQQLLQQQQHTPNAGDINLNSSMTRDFQRELQVDLYRFLFWLIFVRLFYSCFSLFFLQLF